MKRSLRAAAAAFAFAAAAFAAVPAAAQEADFEKIVRQVDELDDFTGLDFQAVYTIVSDKPGEKQAVTEIRMFRRDAKKQFMLLVQLPEANKGQGYLREGDNFWFYDPTSRKFQHSSLKENIGDTESKSGDFSDNSILDDYAIVSGVEGAVGKFPVWIIELKAKNTDVNYDVVRLYVRKDRPLILKKEDLSVNGRLMRTTLFPKYADVGKGRLYPSQMLIRDEINKGEQSQITLTEMSTDKIKDVTFTKAFLEGKS